MVNLYHAISTNWPRVGRIPMASSRSGCRCRRRLTPTRSRSCAVSDVLSMRRCGPPSCTRCCWSDPCRRSNWTRRGLRGGLNNRGDQGAHRGGRRSTAALLARWVTDQAGLERYAGNALPTTDDRPRIEYGGWVLAEDFWVTLPHLRPARRSTGDRRQRVVAGRDRARARRAG